MQAAAGRLAKVYSRAVTLGDGFDDAQTQSRAVSFCGGAPIKAIEYALLIRRWNAGAGVADFEESPLRRGSAAHLNGSAQRRVAHGIVDKIARQGAKCLAIAQDVESGRRVQTQVDFAGER